MRTFLDGLGTRIEAANLPWRHGWLTNSICNDGLCVLILNLNSVIELQAVLETVSVANASLLKNRLSLKG
jgi:hypothetical protein